MENYPKEAKLKSGEKIELRLFSRDDLDLLIDFYTSLPEKDRMFLRIDVLKRENIVKRYGDPNYDHIYPIIALHKEKIIGEGTLFRPEFGWMRHLGELRCVVSNKYKRKGLCTILVREIFLRAVSTDLYKIQAAMMEEQKSAISAFKRMGFKQEALLKKHVTDIQGKRHNLIIMNLDIEELWYLMEDYTHGKTYVV
ncbi:MAG: GNAT family N-acetyltransferase [Calditrichae bacterium]|nr:GNAT family N-acetyltransferase [Calditrichia bacterium]